MHRIELCLLCAFVFAVTSWGCTKKKERPLPKEKAQAAQQALDAEKAEAKASWIFATAKDASALTALAQASEGWRALFQNKAFEALKAFRAVKTPSMLERIGHARASLDLVDAYSVLAELEGAVEQVHSKAEDSRPNSTQSRPWRLFVRARTAQLHGKSEAAVEAISSIDETHPQAFALAQATLPGAKSDLAQLLMGTGDVKTLKRPEWLSTEYDRRLSVFATIKQTGLTRGVIRRFEKLSAEKPDIISGSDQAKSVYWDPVLRRLPVVFYALEALQALDGVSGWPALLRAQAFNALGRYEEALAELESVARLDSSQIPYALLVISPFASPSALEAEAQARKAVTLFRMGRQKDAKVLIQNLPRVTISQRVRVAWALSQLGDSLPDGFPEDRSKMTSVYRALLGELKTKGDGVATVQELGLVERYVDQVQRRWAETLLVAGKPAHAARARSAAEDKSALMRVSARNSVAALLASARDNFRIGRGRVTNKYLGRVENDFPAVKRVASRLRDLLSFKAMEHGDSASAGQGQ